MRQLKITKSITNRETASLDKYLQEIKTATMAEKQKAYLILSDIYSDIADLPSANPYFVEFQSAGPVLSNLVATTNPSAVITPGTPQHVEGI